MYHSHILMYKSENHFGQPKFLWLFSYSFPIIINVWSLYQFIFIYEIYHIKKIIKQPSSIAHMELEIMWLGTTFFTINARIIALGLLICNSFSNFAGLSNFHCIVWIRSNLVEENKQFFKSESKNGSIIPENKFNSIYYNLCR